MKKLLIIFAASILGMVACNEERVETNSDEFNVSPISAPAIGWGDSRPIKFVLRHGGDCYCPGCACPGCPCPLGACGCSGMAFNNGGSLGSDEGLLTLEYIDGEIAVLKFSQTTAINDPAVMPNDFVPISGGDFLEFNLEICQELGVNSIKIPAGNYVVDYSNNIYGEITVPIVWN
jgi:hypothetical protein